MNKTAILFFALLCAVAVSAQDQKKPADGGLAGGKKAVEVFTKKKLDDEFLKRKKEGWSPVILPNISASTDIGFLGGLIGGFCYNGTRDNPYFEYSPYILAVTAAAAGSTKGAQGYALQFDAPYIGNTPLRLMGSGGYSKNLLDTYYGRDSGTNRHLLTRYGASYGNFARYQKRFLNASDPLNPLSPLYTKPVNNRFNNYKNEQFNGYLMAMVEIFKYLSFSVGYGFELVDIKTWAGRKFDCDAGRNVISAQTLIDLDPDAMFDPRKAFISLARAGVAFSTIDYEPDPHNGVLIDYTILVSSKYIGSDVSYLRHTFGARFYYSPVYQFTIAARIAYTATTGHVPFYDLGMFSFFYNPSTWQLIRGYRLGRFIGIAMTMGNLELRWQFVEFKILKQRFALKLAAFVDAGCGFSDWKDPFTTWNRYHLGYGPGLMISYNLSTILSFYYGFSKEDQTFNFGFGYSF